MLRATITNVVDDHLTPASTVEVDGRSAPVPARSDEGYVLFWHRVHTALVTIGYRMPFGAPDRAETDGTTYTVDVVPIDEED